ncbi:MAG: peptide deformylase [Desulfatiglandaceae bacterium]
MTNKAPSEIIDLGPGRIKGMNTDENSENMKIFTYPNPVLRAKAAPVKNIDGPLQAFVEGMIRTMYVAPGIGLAANQVGELKRVIVFDQNPREEGRSPSVLINPEICDGEGKVSTEEACLSVIDFSADVTRMAHVHVKGLDRHGKPFEIEAEGLLAICLQHEIDHLDGVLYIDHISTLKRNLYKKKLKKMLKRP